MIFKSAPDPKAGPHLTQLWRVQKVRKVQVFQNFFPPGAVDSPNLIQTNSTWDIP